MKKLKAWWSDDGKWFSITMVNWGETVVLTSDEAHDLLKAITCSTFPVSTGASE